MSTLGERLKQLRGKASQKQFAQTLGIPPTTLANYESNKSELNFTMIELFTSKFNISTDWLIFGRGPMHPEKSATTPEKAPESAPQAACQRCMELEVRLEQAEKALEEERLERRDLSNENRRLWKENAELRERCARLEERMEKPAVGRCPQKTGMAG